MILSLAIKQFNRKIPSFGRTLQQMQSSKSKTSLAYAKLCRQKSQPQLKSNQALNSAFSSDDYKQNICDEVISGLDEDQSQYITQLLSKQLKKTINTHIQQKDIHPPRVFHDCSNSHNTAQNTPKYTSNSVELSQVTVKPASGNQHSSNRVTQKKKLEQVISSSNSKFFPSQEEISRKSQFIDDLNEYLTEITASSSKGIYNQRRTHLRSSQNHYQNKGIQNQIHQDQQYSVSLVKYNIILSQFQKLLHKSDILQQRNEQKERKIQEMSKVIAEMCCQMEKLKRTLKKTYQEREMYMTYCQNLHQTVPKKQSKSKPKQSIIQHMKRYSHVPITDDDSEYGTISKRQLRHRYADKIEISYLNKFKEENNSLKKKRYHQYKKPKNRETEDSDQLFGLYLPLKRSD